VVLGVRQESRHPGRRQLDLAGRDLPFFGETMAAIRSWKKESIR
jgi:hypothetical protein